MVPLVVPFTTTVTPGKGEPEESNTHDRDGEGLLVIPELLKSTPRGVITIKLSLSI
jgi:hypothetical protein